MPLHKLDEPDSLKRLRSFLGCRAGPCVQAHPNWSLAKQLLAPRLLANAQLFQRRDALTGISSGLKRTEDKTGSGFEPEEFPRMMAAGPVEHESTVPRSMTSLMTTNPNSLGIQSSGTLSLMFETGASKSDVTIGGSAATLTPTGRYFQSLLSQSTGSSDRSDSRALSSEQLANRTAEQSKLELVERLDHESPPRVLPAGLQEFLAARLGLNIASNVRVHVGPAADQLVSLYKADAVSFADRIAFRHDRYEPRTLAGDALIGHELTHIAAGSAHALAGSGMSLAREEALAQANENRLYGEGANAPLQMPRSPPTAPVPAPAQPATQLSPIRTAGIDRPLPSDAAAPATLNTEDIKAELFRDLLDRLRTDFERGS